MATKLYAIPIGRGKHRCCPPKLMEETDVIDTAVDVWKPLFWAICQTLSDFYFSPFQGRLIVQ